MKTIEELLKNLARPEVLEFGLVTNRLPSVNIGGVFEPVDDAAPGTARLLEMLATMGGARHVDALGEAPVSWTTRLAGVGVIAIAAMQRGDVVQARFTVTRRESARPPSARRASSKLPPSSRSSASRRPGGASVRPAATWADLHEDGEPTLHLLSPLPRDASASAAPGGAAGERALGPAAGIEALLTLAIETRATDLVLSAGRPAFVRIATELVPLSEPLDAEHVERIAREIMPIRLHEALEERGSCAFALELAALGRFRVSVSRHRAGHAVSVRVLPRDIPSLASLGLPSAVAGALAHESGLVLVAAPAAHGKSSILAALVDHLSRESSRHIATIEDPIELVFPRNEGLVSQRDVALHARSKARAIEAAMRDDAGVVVIADMSDAASMRAALDAVDEGRLVLGAMSAPTVASALTRLLCAGPGQARARAVLASSLRLAIGQRLVPSSDRTRLHGAVELLPWSVPVARLLRAGRVGEIAALHERGEAPGGVRRRDSLDALVRAQKIRAEDAARGAPWADPPREGGPA